MGGVGGAGEWAVRAAERPDAVQPCRKESATGYEATCAGSGGGWLRRVRRCGGNGGGGAAVIAACACSRCTCARRLRRQRFAGGWEERTGRLLLQRGAATEAEAEHAL